MFGEMEVTTVLNLNRSTTLETAVSELLEFTERPAIARWLQMPRALTVFLMQPDDPDSGVIYVYDRSKCAWCWVDFKDTNYGGYSASDFDRLLNECRFLNLVAVRGRLSSPVRWFVNPGCCPEVLPLSRCPVSH